PRRAGRRAPRAVATVEVLTSDFDGIDEHLIRVLDADPEIFAHNVEPVPRLHRMVRPRFRYERSLKVLARAKDLRPDNYTKSNIKVDLGEPKAEVIQEMPDPRDAARH